MAVAKIDDAGITSTGAASSGNQLPALEEEYAKYRRAKNLWDESKKSVSYRQGNLGEIIRVENGREVTLHGNN